MREFGELEAMIMDRMWGHPGPMSVREVLTHIQEQRHIAYTTVLTVMDRLAGKGWLHREMIGRAWVYTPAESRDAYSARLIREALDSANDRQGALASFVSTMTPAERDALKAMLRSRGKGAT